MMMRGEGWDDQEKTLCMSKFISNHDISLIHTPLFSPSFLYPGFSYAEFHLPSLTLLALVTTLITNDGELLQQYDMPCDD